MKILVIGGTRFIGRQLVFEFAERGHEVTVFNRGHTQPEFPKTVSHITGDRQDPEALRKALSCQNFDAVIDNIAYTPVDVDSFQQAAQEWAGRYFLTSTAWVYAMSKPAEHQTLTESIWSPDDYISEGVSKIQLESQGIQGVSQKYILGKLAAEKVAFSMNRPVTIFRPGMVSGALDHTGRLAYFFKNRPETDNLEKFQLLWVEDLGRAMVGMLEKPTNEKTVFNVAPPECVSRQDMYRWIQEAIPSGDFPEDIPVPQVDPLITQVHGLYDSSRLMAALPDYRFTGTQEWVKKSAREMSEPRTNHLKAMSPL